MTHSSWLELSRSNLAHNLNQIKALCPGADLVPVIKANAYGAGAEGMAKELRNLGVRRFAVATVEEGIELREHGIIERVVCLAPFAPDDADTLVEHLLTPSLFTNVAVQRLSDVVDHRKDPLDVWVKVDTGLHRFGVAAELAAEFLDRLSGQNVLRVETVFSTLLEDPDKDRDQAQQLVDLRHAVPQLKDVPLSLASSYGILSRGGADLLDIVRPGIMLHGFLPSAMDRLDRERSLIADLRPIATWKTRVAQTRVVPKGGQVGYGAGKGLDRDTPVATITVGWSDGYGRSASDDASVMIKGRRCRVLSVSANATMVDTSAAAGVSEGDEVVLVGSQRDAEIKATELLPGGAVYRVFANIPPRVPRVWS